MSSESLSSILSEHRDGLAQSYLTACSAGSKAKSLVTISLVNHCFMLGMAIEFILSFIPMDHKLVLKRLTLSTEVTCGDSTAMFTIHSYALSSCKTLEIWSVLCPTVPTTLWAAPTAVDVATICISSWNIYDDSCVQYVKVTEVVGKSCTKPTLVQTLCRDGSIYFLVLGILNGITIALWYLKISDDFALVASSDQVSATSIAISRFTLNMQDACFDLQDPTGLGLSYMSRMQTTLQFNHQIDTEQPSTGPAMGDAYDQASFHYD
ncbi:hypothetical protein WOLCODRAFT_21278 [Wolfiporia cocos MD-104 SS10]|uniref:Uncharacterized protein n=1 Tax=Wolfiporia cocos (strain MD-104) TaxID=742152 RepID=A0A2H3JML1_WOLCO|nr:hypothetical protein WOLCODRAFT_21278 [Wolfiporia cocos MD-104 SS10]